MTESTAPLAPQYNLMSAARETVAKMVSRSRCGKRGTVRYARGLKIVVTRVSWPALRLRLPCTQVPSAGEQTRPFGSARVSFAVPVHQRGPFRSEFSGFALAEPRPHEVFRQAPG